MILTVVFYTFYKRNHIIIIIHFETFFSAVGILRRIGMEVIVDERGLGSM